MVNAVNLFFDIGYDKATGYVFPLTSFSMLRNLVLFQPNYPATNCNMMLWPFST